MKFKLSVQKYLSSRSTLQPFLFYLLPYSLFPIPFPSSNVQKHELKPDIVTTLFSHRTRNAREKQFLLKTLSRSTKAATQKLAPGAIADRSTPLATLSQELTIKLPLSTKKRAKFRSLSQYCALFMRRSDRVSVELLFFLLQPFRLHCIFTMYNYIARTKV